MFWLIVSVSDSVSSRVWRPHHRTQSRLRDLVDGRRGVLDRHHGADRIGDAIVGDGGNIDADVVAGDDPLRLDRHRDDAQRNAMDAIDERHEHDQARPPRGIPTAPA